MVINTRNAKIEHVLILGVLLTVGITWAYANSYYLYVVLSLGAAMFSYGLFFVRFSKIEVNCRRICVFLLVVSLLTGAIFRLNPKSMVMVNISLLFPFAFSTFNIDTTNVKKGSVIASILALAIVFGQNQFGILGYINSNTLSFMAYMGVSISFIWFELSKRKVIPALFLLASFFVILQIGSRNTGVVIVICLLLLLIPRKIMTNKIVYRLTYLLTLGYTVFILRIMEWGFSNPTVTSILYNYTSSFSGKSWSMESRMFFLAEIREKIAALDFVTQILGEGVCQHLGHNLFYQCVFVWGYIGTVLIYIMLIIVFEMGYREAKRGNKLVFGCAIILIGHIIINGADVYLFGSETCNFLPLIVMGLMIQQYMSRQCCVEGSADSITVNRNGI